MFLVCRDDGNKQNSLFAFLSPPLGLSKSNKNSVGRPKDPFNMGGRDKYLFSS